MKGDSNIFPAKLKSCAKSMDIAVPNDSPYKIILLSSMPFELSHFLAARASKYNPSSLGLPSFPLNPLYAIIK